MAQDELRYGPLGEQCLHLCIDMQVLFGGQTEWHTPWMQRVTPMVERIAAAHPERTIFTRFIPADRPGQGTGTWRRYWERWPSMTKERLPEDALDLLPPLRKLVPPAELFDKAVYSPWVCGTLHPRLQKRGVDTLIITGAETDVCVLAAVLGAVDLGYRVLVPTDAICSSSDRTHDALLALYNERYGQQVEAVTTELVLREWR